ncbi:uncharacterized protein LOC127878111 isoform X2 [Dreissena polymorpha]|uniref:uncharacterized protein LOC127878111 isoform X2 n=1 Tax=Dreissena polymorpha TaxID=45954 RepID=UPI002263E9DD|nr:uncharacterized protein LOC127878111 isoform X2 [Dreissena polymorpha]
MDELEQEDIARALILPREEDERVPRNRSKLKGSKEYCQQEHSIYVTSTEEDGNKTPFNGELATKQAFMELAAKDDILVLEQYELQSALALSLQEHTKTQSSGREVCGYTVARDDRLRPVERGIADTSTEENGKETPFTNKVATKQAFINLAAKDEILRDEQEELQLGLALSLQETTNARSNGRHGCGYLITKDDRPRLVKRGMAVAPKDLEEIEELRCDNSEAVARVLQDEYDSETVHLEEEAINLISEEEVYSDLQKKLPQNCMGSASIEDSEMVARELQAKYDAELREIEKQTQLLKAEELENASSAFRLKRPARRDQVKRNGHSSQTSNGADSDNEYRRLFNSSPLKMFSMQGPENEVYQESVAARNSALYNLLTGANSNPPIQRLQQDESVEFLDPDDLTYEQMVELQDVSRGLSNTVRSQLPTERYKQNNKEKSEECPVCMEKYVEGVHLTTLPCFHSYHSKCIDKWFTDHDICPVCRLEIKIKS